MAVGTPVAGTLAGDNGDLVSPSYPASTVADDIVFLMAIFHTVDTPVPTAINWPAGFTEIEVLQVKDASGVSAGVAGIAWRRATGSLSGTVNVTPDQITAGANSAAAGIMYRVPGCVTTGEPWEEFASANPNYTSTVTRPSVTHTRSTGGLSIIFHLNSDNINLGPPTSPGTWTSVSNASSQGRDSAIDVDWYAPGATGTVSPASGTQSSANATGWALWHFALTDTAGSTNYEIDAQPGSYAVTGVAAGTKQGYVVNAAPGSYAITGAATPRAYGRFINAAPGSYALSGTATGHLRNRVLIASPGSYALTGVAAELATLTHYVIDAQPGAYALTGAAASLTQGYVLNAAPGSYALTGLSAQLARGRFINAAPGSYAVTGAGAGVLVGRVLVASPGSYAVTGVVADLVYEPVAGAYVLNCEPGSYAVTGAGAGLLSDRVIVAAPGSYTLTGQQAAVVAGRVLNAGSGAYLVTGTAMNSLRDYVLSASPGEYNITGFLANLVKQGPVVYVPPAEGDINSITAEGGIELLSAEGTIVVIGPQGEIWLIT